MVALKPDAPAKEFGVTTGFPGASGFNGIVPAQLANDEIVIETMCGSIFFTEIFTEVVVKGRVRIAERPLCGPLPTLRFIAGTEHRKN